MKQTITLMTIAAIFAAKPTMAKGPEALPNREVSIRLFNASAPAEIVGPAKHIASKVLAQAGIGLVWRTTYKPEPIMEMGACGDRKLQTIDIAFAQKAPSNLPGSAMAIAHPFSSGGVRIIVFWDRVQSMHQVNTSSTLRAVLGHVLAHEIGHILIGKYEHSVTGLMKARFSHSDEGWMSKEPLPIEPSDIEAMQSNLDNPRPACPVLAAK